MTLASAVARLRARTGIDLDTEVDITAAVDTTSEVATTELMKAARKVSRATYHLFTLNSALTLTACTTGASAGAELNLLDTTTSAHKSALPIFHCYGVRINGSWLREMNWQDFLDSFPNYLTDGATANPAFYVPISPSHIRFVQPGNATAVAATNHAIGFYLHPTYTYALNSATELLGPEEFHELIVERAYLDLTEGLVRGASALQSRATQKQEFDDKCAGFEAFNKARAKKSNRKGGAGNVRRIFSLGGGY
jgi:hypothetical protein